MGGNEDKYKLSAEQENLLFNSPIESMKIILESGKEHFDSIEKADDVVLSKSNNLLQIQLGLFTAVFAYIIANNDLSNYVIIPAVIFCVGSLISIYYSFKASGLGATSLKSARPGDLINNEILKDSEVERVLLYTLVRDMHKGIERNDDAQINRVNQYKISLTLFILAVLTAVITYLAVIYLQS